MINDTYGHQSGDMLLMEVVKRLAGAIRVNDLLARMGGDEFALLMPETDLAQANRAVEKIASLVRNTKVKEDLTISFSFGLATFVNPTDSVVEMVHRADRLLYRAKGQGKNKLVAEEIF